MGLFVKKTSCEIGGNLNVRTEKHGDEDVGACDFALHGIMLDRDDLNELFDDKYYWESVFNKKGKLVEPMTRLIEPAQFVRKFEKSIVTLWLGVGEESLKLSECKIRKIRLSHETGGLTAMSLQVQCNPDEKELSILYRYQHTAATSASIRFGKEEKPREKEQPELPMDHNAEGKDDSGKVVPIGKGKDKDGDKDVTTH